MEVAANYTFLYDLDGITQKRNGGLVISEYPESVGRSINH